MTNIEHNNLTSSVICKEVFDEGYQPSAEEIYEYAQRIGINPKTEEHLLYLARDGLMQALPDDWKVCYHQPHGIYYFNTTTKESQWDHPLDNLYKKLVDKARHSNQHQQKQQSSDISEDLSQIDSGIKSLPVTEDTMDSSDAAISQLPNNHRFLAPIVGSGGKKELPSLIPTTVIDMNLKQTNKRFQISATKQIDLNINQNSDNNKIIDGGTSGTVGGIPKKELTLSGTGSIFLKSNTKKNFNELNNVGDSIKIITTSSSVNNSLTTAGSTVKGILRDSSLTDVRKKNSLLEFNQQMKRPTDFTVSSSNEYEIEDRKIVRFNMEKTMKKDISPDEDDDDDDDIDDDAYEVNLNDGNRINNQQKNYKNDNNGDVDDNDDDDEDDNGAGGGGAGEDSSNSANSDEIYILPLKSLINKPMLKPQFSLDEIKRPISSKLSMLNRTFSTDSGSDKSNLTTYFDRKLDKSSLQIKPLYEDTDTESGGGGTGGSEHISFKRRDPFNDELQVNDKPVSTASSSMTELTNKYQLANGSIERNKYKKLQENTEKELAEKNRLQLASEQKKIEMLEKFKAEELNLKHQFEIEKSKVENELKIKLNTLNEEMDLKLINKKQEIQLKQNDEIDNYEQELKDDFESRRIEISLKHRSTVDVLQKNHSEILADLERDLKTEEELVKKDHITRLSQLKDKVTHELELERQRMRETGDNHLFEKLRCEKRLLEDKYRCLKEKYIRLKGDLKITLEQRSHHHHRRQTSGRTTNTTTTGSETERSGSQTKGGETKSLSLSHQPSSQQQQQHNKNTLDYGKPPVTPTTTIAPASLPVSKTKDFKINNKNSNKLGVAANYISHIQHHNHDDLNSYSQSDTTVSNNYEKIKKHLLISPNFGVGGVADGGGDNGNSDSEAIQSVSMSGYKNETNNNNNNNNNNCPTDPMRKRLFSRIKSASTSRLNSSDHPNNKQQQQHQQQQQQQQQQHRSQNQHHQQTNSNKSTIGGDIHSSSIIRACTPVENLRRQLQKLEELEDQFPDNTLVDITYHLRYPFKDVTTIIGATGTGNSSANNKDHPGITSSAELEFFKHRIHMERDSVRRAKESLRTQRANFRQRQREMKQNHQHHQQQQQHHHHHQNHQPNSTTKQTNRNTLMMDNLIKEEKELTELEVNLHRTRALLGEKVIRLKYLEHSLQRLYEKEKKKVLIDHLSSDSGGFGGSGGNGGGSGSAGDSGGAHHFNKEDITTVSDLSSHSSSGFSSTDYAGDTKHNEIAFNIHQHHHQNQRDTTSATEIIKNLENLNAEVKEIWEILSKQQTNIGLPPPPSMVFGWTGPLAITNSNLTQSSMTSAILQQQQPSSIAGQLGQKYLNRFESFDRTNENQLENLIVSQKMSSSSSPTTDATSGAKIVNGTESGGGGGGNNIGNVSDENVGVSVGVAGTGGFIGGHTSSLVERTQDLRNWLKQAKTHEFLTSIKTFNSQPNSQKND